jgi:hypothetical protein
MRGGGLARARKSTQDGAMKRIVASLWVCWVAYCGLESNTFPLAFGMTVPEASAALGVPLAFYGARGSSEIYVASGTPAIPGFYPSDSALALQFRKGRLTGWKKDWQMRRPWPF